MCMASFPSPCVTGDPDAIDPDSFLVSAPFSRKPERKKKNRDEPKLLAGNIPGNIGDKDVDYLTHYVIGQNARPAAAAAPARRDRKPVDRAKDNDKKKKTPERSNSQPESTSSDDKVMDKMAKGRRSTSPLDRASSPSHSHAASVASYAAEEFILRDEFSDDEKGYHTDQDSGFQLINGRKRFNRQHRMSRLPVNRQHFHATTRPYVLTAATPSSPTPSSPSFSGTAFSVSGASASASGSANLTSRGYESEKEFYPDNFSSRQATVRRRKTASSMPHSQRNSPENSDVDSSLSLPIVHRTPPPAPPPVTEDEHSGRISYAQIARSASAAVPAVTAAAPAAVSSTARPSTSNGSSSTTVVIKSGTGASVTADTGAKVRSAAAGKTAPPKSNIGDESAHVHDNLSAEGRSSTQSTAFAGAGSESATAAFTTARVGLHQEEMCDTKTTAAEICAPRLPSSLPSTSGATTDNRQQVRKHNSIPDAVAQKSMIMTKAMNRSLDSTRPYQLPAVIMCEDSGADHGNKPNVPVQAAVTFGFFDDVSDEGTTKKAAVANGAHEENQKQGSAWFRDQRSADRSSCHSSASDSAAAPLPADGSRPAAAPASASAGGGRRQEQGGDERRGGSQGGLKAQRPVGPSSISYPPDADIETFNYNEILAYIRKGLCLDPVFGRKRGI